MRGKIEAYHGQSSMERRKGENGLNYHCRLFLPLTKIQKIGQKIWQ